MRKTFDDCKTQDEMNAFMRDLANKYAKAGKAYEKKERRENGLGKKIGEWRTALFARCPLRIFCYKNECVLGLSRICDKPYGED